MVFIFLLKEFRGVTLMPRTKLTFVNNFDNQIIGTIEKYRAIKGLRLEDIANRLEISRITIYRKKKNPSAFTLAELKKIYDYLGVPNEERRIEI